MDLPIEHLATFAAIVEQGSFEGAARQLHITPSAVSQRVRAMEQRIGAVLLRRSRPVEVTEAGTAVLRAARQVERIAGDLAAELGQGSTGGSLIPIVVNADSLATWFVPALARAARETGARFEVIRADETLSTDHLRRGAAMAAVTATREPVPGCTVARLGVDRYRAVASPAFAAQHFPDGPGVEALRGATMIEFDRHDIFQQRFLRRISRSGIVPPRHYVPSSSEFALAVELGMGWGMLPALQCADALAEGRLVEVSPGTVIELPLYWQRWNLSSPVLDALSAIVAEEAGAALG
ncbi:LysR family transcriptional regulator ArgP [Leucobacter triazinivorans]|uniref:LysR family transcriptional regulator ArgP n=1 Tax=Leucobacter triazinivorans TaxID=1784719 RepID=A0A4P6KET7_9MICO|nr:LysR family transcriptional regulator ArgP [Leucobacter triazinivorans]QBE48792.1 LysR family transcriptional regulator ArgP [Leucobacter triazinivorans]